MSFELKNDEIPPGAIESDASIEPQARNFFLFTVFSTIFSFFYIRLISGNLSVEDYGAVNLFSSIYALSATFISFGLYNTILIFLPEKIQKQDYDEVYQFSRAIMRIFLINSSIISTVFLVISPMLCFFIFGANSSYLPYFFPLGIIIFLYNIEQVLAYFLQATRQFNRFVKLNSIATILSFLIAFLLIQFGILAIFISWIVVEAFKCFSGYFLLKTSIFKKKAHRMSIKKIFKTSIPFFLHDIILSITQWQSYYFILSQLDLNSVGLFSFAMNLSNFFFLLLVSPLRTLVPLISSTRGTETRFQDENYYRLYKTINSIYMYILIPAIPIMLGLGKYLIFILSSKYLITAPIVSLLCLGRIFSIFSCVNIAIIQARNEIKTWLIPRTILLAFGFLEIFFFIQWFGLMGAALGYSLILLLEFLLGFYFLRKKAPLFRFPVKKAILVAVSAVIIILPLIFVRGIDFQNLSFYSFIWDSILIAVGVAIYIFLVIQIIGRNEIVLFKNAFKKILNGKREEIFDKILQKLKIRQGLDEEPVLKDLRKYSDPAHFTFNEGGRESD